MAMVLEYPMKLFILIVVVLVVVGIMIKYKDKIMDLSFFDKDEEEKCEVKTEVVSEAALNTAVLEKYCDLCYLKNEQGECKDDALCYVINTNLINPSTITINKDYCSITCNKEVTSVNVQYKWFTGTVEIAC